MDKAIELKKIYEYTDDDWRYINKRLEAVGMPQLIINNGYVYKDEIHLLLGIGIKIKAQ